MSSEIFETYSFEYQTLASSIRDKLQEFSSFSSDQRKLAVNALQRDIEEAEEMVQSIITIVLYQMSHMELEAGSLPLNTRQPLQLKVKQYKLDLKKYGADLKLQGDKDALFGGVVIDIEESEGSAQRARLMKGTDRLLDGTKRLDEARRVAYETEAIGISTLEDLNRQREQILRTRNTLDNADSWITKSQSLLKTMQNRLATNKLLQWGIVAMLVMIILIVIYLKWMS